MIGDKIELRDYQKEAINRWIKNNFKGIFSMATGTGKTLVALEGIRGFLNEEKIGLVIVPTKVLLNQWKEIIKNLFPRAIVVCCYSGNYKWRKDLEKIVKLYIIENRVKNFFNNRQKIVISTMGIACKEEFKKIIESISPDDAVVVVDEAHHIGAFTYRNICELHFKKRLGLTATPVRDWDYTGNNKIKEYFGKIIYRYTIADGIIDGYLVPYKYHLELVSLTLDELKKYLELSEEIKNVVFYLKNKYGNYYSIKEMIGLAEEIDIDEVSINRLRGLLIMRRKIIKNCKNKYYGILNIIRDNITNLKRCLIYCEDYKQLDKLKNLLAKEDLSFGEYTSRLDDDEREINLRAFKDEHIQFLISCKCLDEGVDIPACESAILIANSTVEREFIQRRGRLLRPYPGKKNAAIFDLLVLPYTQTENKIRLDPVELNILEREIDRAKFFAEDAINKAEVLEKINLIYEILYNYYGRN